MTYGWAILIIAIVLAALFQLGVFNPMVFAPKASPGSCQVIRPEGAGRANFISLEGECQGLLPQYVAQFNGTSSRIETPQSSLSALLPNADPLTVTAWINPVSVSHSTTYTVVTVDPISTGVFAERFQMDANTNNGLNAAFGLGGLLINSNGNDGGNQYSSLDPPAGT